MKVETEIEAETETFPKLEHEGEPLSKGIPALPEASQHRGILCEVFNAG
jgi:hypothetical protein